MTDYSDLKAVLEQSKKDRSTKNEFTQGLWSISFETHGWDTLFLITRDGAEKVRGIVNDKSFTYADPKDKEINNIIQNVIHEILPGLSADNATLATDMPDWQKKAIHKAILSEYPYAKLNDLEPFHEELSPSRDETNDFLLQVAYDAREASSEDILDDLRGKIWDGFINDIDDQEYDLLDRAKLSDNHIDQAESERCLDYLRECIQFEPPYDYFLKQDMKVNIMFSTPEERNDSHTAIRRQNSAISVPDTMIAGSAQDYHQIMEMATGLSWLVRQQGHTMEELQDTHKKFHDLFESAHQLTGWAVEIGGKVYTDYNDAYNALCQSQNKFLVSICQELDNHTYDMGVMTVLSKMDMNDYASLADKDKEVVLPKDSMIGIFNPWNGSGSVLEIELEKDLILPTDMIYDTQIEGVNLDFGYTVDQCFGLVGTCWKDIKEVRNVTPQQDLADMLNDVQMRAQEQVIQGNSRGTQPELSR